jgi:hypothetical protein
MAHWVIPLYIISGIVMAIGAYLTIRYRPYCTLKSPEREFAMELHRKKLMNEIMSQDEIKKNELYKRNTHLFNYWSGVLAISAIVHIFILIGSIGTDLMMVKIIIGLIIFGEHGWITGTTNGLPYCIKFFSFGGWSKAEQLSYINGYYKNIVSWYNSPIFYFKLQQFWLILGVILNIVFDVWIGSNNFKLLTY